jgi:hypothetical protein
MIDCLAYAIDLPVGDGSTLCLGYVPSRDIARRKAVALRALLVDLDPPCEVTFRETVVQRPTDDLRGYQPITYLTNDAGEPTHRVVGGLVEAVPAAVIEEQIEEPAEDADVAA